MKKGFTLIEVLAVIVVLGILITLIVPIVNKAIDKSRYASEDAQRQEIITATKNYMADNDVTITNTSYISISSLKTNGYLKNVDTLNPRDNSSMNNYCVKVSWDGTRYGYTMVTSCDGEIGSEVIINTPENPVVVTEEEPIQSTGVELGTLLKQQYKSANTVGLLKNGDTYYYRGGNSDVTNNFVWFGGFEWEVIEINNSGVLMRTTRPQTAIQVAESGWDTLEKYQNSYLNIWLNSLGDDGVFYKSMNETDRAKMVDNVFNVGLYTNSTSTISSITYTGKVGVLDVAQYNRAGTDGTSGYNSFLDQKQASVLGNYNSSTRYNHVTFLGVVANTNVMYSSQVFPVVRVSNFTITRGDGTELNPYRANDTSTNTSNIKVGEYIDIPSPNCGEDYCLFRVVSRDNDSVKVILNGFLNDPTTYGLSSTYAASNPVGTNAISFISTIPEAVRYTGNKVFNIGKYTTNTAGGLNYNLVKQTTYTGQTGVPVIGELFTADDLYYNENIWTMNCFNELGYVNCVHEQGTYSCKTTDSAYIRPVTYIKSGTSNALTFKSGTGHPFDPYVLNQ